MQSIAAPMATLCLDSLDNAVSNLKLPARTYSDILHHPFVTRTKMSAFLYDEESLRLCAALPTEDNIACASLFTQHQLHYGRPPYPSIQSKVIRLNRFLQSVTFVHNHNSLTETLRFNVTLNQFSDCEPYELPLHDFDFYSPAVSHSFYNGGDKHDVEDESHEQILNNKDYSRALPIEADKSVHELIREDMKVNSNTGPVWISASNIRTYRTSRKDDGNKQDGSLVQYHDALGDFIADPMNKDWTQYLNWATADNPDGVSIVHPSSDQVIRLNLHYDRMYVRGTFIYSCILFTGKLWKLLGIFGYRFVGS